ncbi:unnamed protein product, partial [Allacma fusca]
RLSVLRTNQSPNSSDAKRRTNSLLVRSNSVSRVVNKSQQEKRHEKREGIDDRSLEATP